MEEKTIVEEKLIKELLSNKDEFRGIEFDADRRYILKHKGEEGLRLVEEKMRQWLGQDFRYDAFNTFPFYPMGLFVLSLLAIQETLSFTGEKIKEMGKEAPKFAVFIKIMLSFFTSTQRIKKEIPKGWRKYHTTGELELIVPDIPFEEIKLPGHSAIARLTNHSVHPIYCLYLSGYFEKVGEMFIGSKSTCQEVKCVFRGDKYHEFLVSW